MSSKDKLITIREDAIGGRKTELFKVCAACEDVDIDVLVVGVAWGTIAGTKNVYHDFDHIIVIGKGTSTRVNANIGASRYTIDLDSEIEKLQVPVKAGADLDDKFGIDALF